MVYILYIFSQYWAINIYYRFIWILHLYYWTKYYSVFIIINIYGAICTIDGNYINISGKGISIKILHCRSSSFVSFALGRNLSFP